MSHFLSSLYIRLCLKYPLPLSDFNETRIFMTDFPKIPKYKKLTVHRIEAEMFHAGRQRDEQTDMTWYDEAHSPFFVISQMHLKTRIQVIWNTGLLHTPRRMTYVGEDTEWKLWRVGYVVCMEQVRCWKADSWLGFPRILCLLLKPRNAVFTSAHHLSLFCAWLTVCLLNLFV